jgi:hypothetical protein
MLEDLRPGILPGQALLLIMPIIS